MASEVESFFSDCAEPERYKFLKLNWNEGNASLYYTVPLPEQGMFRCWFAAVVCHLRSLLKSTPKPRYFYKLSTLLFCVRTWWMNQINAYVRKIHCWPRFWILYEGIDRSNMCMDRSSNPTGEVSLYSAASPQRLAACKHRCTNCHMTATP